MALYLLVEHNPWKYTVSKMGEIGGSYVRMRTLDREIHQPISTPYGHFFKYF